MRPKSLLARVLVLFAAACGGAPPAAAPEPAPKAAPAAPNVTTSFTTVKVADGVYAFVAPEGRSAIVNSNSVAVVGDDGVLVVDTTSFRASARLEIAALKALTDKPVRYVLTTHWHQDHLRGNPEYRDAFPGVVFVAQTETRRLEEVKDPKNIDAVVHRYPEILAQLKARNRPEDRALIEDLEAGGDDWTRAELVEPTVTFDDAMTIWLGKREVRLMHLGCGNTAGDAIAYVPDVKVLCTGDLVVAPTPYAIGSYLGEWDAVMTKLMAIDATAIVPGHGPVMHDWSYARQVQEALRSISAQAKDAVGRGLDLDATRRAIDVSALRARFAGDSALRGDNWDKYFVQPGVARAWQEARGAMEPE